MGDRPLPNLMTRLVEVNLAIENLDAWATRPQDVAELERLEQLRESLKSAIDAMDARVRAQPRTSVNPSTSYDAPAGADP